MLPPILFQDSDASDFHPAPLLIDDDSTSSEEYDAGMVGQEADPGLTAVEELHENNLNPIIEHQVTFPQASVLK